MIVIGVATVVSGVLLIGLPMYWQPGEGQLMLMMYTGVLRSLLLVVFEFIHKYWLGLRE